MAKIDSDESCLGNILQKKFYYQIPIYQRPYQWTKENCEKLLDDLFEDFEDYEKNRENGESDYFCGSLVLIKSDTKTYDIVDGQQRLSTFILLAKVLLALYSDRLDSENQEYLQESLSDRHGDKKERLSFDTIGSNAKKYFENALKYFDDNSHANNKKTTKTTT